jgi:hypothetical protein
MTALDIVKYPFWTLALATGAKSFRDNKVIGSPALNRWGLHASGSSSPIALAGGGGKGSPGW